MFSLGSLWLILLLQTGAALEYPELFTHAARMGSSTTIPCKFNVDAIPPARRSFTILWHFQEKEIFRSPNAPKTADPRLSIDQDRVQDGIADLSVSRVSISDGGLYICSMVQTPEREVKEIRLDIHAPPRITITNKTALINKESVLRCAISGFYPVDIDVKWLRNGEMLDNVTVVTPRRGPDGTYSVNSSVTITPTEEDRKRTFSYRIQHESLTAPFQEDFRLVFGDEERTKQNIIIISVSAAVGVVILITIITVIMCWKRGGRGKGADTEEDQTRRLASSGDVRQPPDPITNTNEEFTRNQQNGPPKEESRSQMTGTKPATTLESSDSAVYSSGKSCIQCAPLHHTEHTGSSVMRGDVRETRDSIYNTNKTSIRNPQPEPREEQNTSQTTGAKPAVHRKPSDTTVYRPGDVRQPRHSINDTNKTSTRNPQPEPREGRNNSQTTGTRSAVHQKSSAACTPGGRRTEKEAGNQSNEHQKLIPGDESGDVRQPRHSINDTKKTSIRNPQPEPREEPNNSQTTGAKPAVLTKPPDSVYSPGHTSWENQDEQTTCIQNRDSQRPERHQAVPADQNTEPSASNQEANMYCFKGNVKNLRAMYEK